MEDIRPILEVIRTLRGENGCPWDQKQTPLTLWKSLAEELYELEDGLVQDDLENICEELGDTLFSLLFIMEVFHESGKISFSQVVNNVTQKMIRRHPHVYGNARVNDQETLKLQWEQIKAQEKANTSDKKKQNPSAMDGVPQGMPGLLRAVKVSKEAVKQGFDWNDIHGVLEQVAEEIEEFKEAYETGTKEEAMLEFGDILFSLVNVARFAGFHPETALTSSTAKFEKRFRRMEELIAQEELRLENLSQKEKDEFWNRAKQDIS